MRKEMLDAKLDGIAKYGDIQISSTGIEIELHKIHTISQSERIQESLDRIAREVKVIKSSVEILKNLYMDNEKKN